ncbi:MAG: phosphoribosyl-ATP pyrophosphohydrolase [bacterium]
MGKTKSYNKLVRDRIPGIIEQAGKEYEIEELDDSEYGKYLQRKLTEEMKEYLNSGKVEELADILEVIRAILTREGMTFEELEEMRRQKKEKRGAFQNKILLKEVRE